MAFVALGSMLLACSVLPARAAPPVTAECRQFDFLVGNWLVRDRATHVVATDSVTRADGDCTLIEKWRGAGEASEGLAVITYQSERKTWHRDALLRSSVILAFEGRMSGGSMVMIAREYSESGVARLHRLSWTPGSNGSVEQLWQISADGGKSWQIRFDEFLSQIAE
jgi:hypothetical protein